SEFGRWVGRVLRQLVRTYPQSEHDFLHVAEGARAFAEGGGRLTYLEETGSPVPKEGGQRQKERSPCGSAVASAAAEANALRAGRLSCGGRRPDPRRGDRRPRARGRRPAPEGTGPLPPGRGQRF